MSKRRIIELTKKDIKQINDMLYYEVSPLPEYGNPCDHFEFSDDLDWVYEQIDIGNEWAWCTIRVTCNIMVHHLSYILDVEPDQIVAAMGLPTDNYSSFMEISGIDYLGACSYRHREDFIHGGGYHDDMRIAAYNDLITQIENFKRIILTTTLTAV